MNFKKSIILLFILAIFNSLLPADDVLSYLQTIPSISDNKPYSPATSNSTATNPNIVTGVAFTGGTGSSGDPAGQAQSPYSMVLNGYNESIDHSSGALILEQTDLTLPGRSGLDVTIKRTYNSKTYNANPLWKSSHEEQFGFWSGFGWQFSVGGKLIVVENIYNYGANGGYDNSGKYTEEKYDSSAVVSLPNGSFQFTSPYDGFYTNNLVKTTTGVFSNVSYYYNFPKYDFLPKKFTQKSEKNSKEAVLLKNNSGNYELILANGTRYLFEKKYYMKEDNCYKQTSGIMESPVVFYNTYYCKVSGYYLTKIIDKYNNKIEVSYTDISSVYSSDYIENKWPYSYHKKKDTYYPTRPISITDTLSRKINFEYASNDRDSAKSSQITKIKYKNSNGVWIEYNYKYNSQNGYLEEVVPPLGKSTKYEYTYKTDCDPKGYLINKVIFPTGATAQYNFNYYTYGEAKGYAIKNIQKSDGSTKTLTYYLDQTYSNDKKTLIFSNIEERNQSNEYMSYIYKDAVLQKSYNQRGETVSYEYDSYKRITKIIQHRRGKDYITINEYNSIYDAPTKIIYYGDPDTSADDTETVISYWYDYMLAQGLANNTDEEKLLYMGKVMDKWLQPRGNGNIKRNWINNVYNQYGDLFISTIMDQTGQQKINTMYEFDSYGQLIRKELVGKTVTEYEYNNSPVPTQETVYANGKDYITKREIYFDTGLLKSETGVNGEKTTYYYDDLSRKNEIVLNNGTRTQIIYDDISNQVTIINPFYQITQIVYDPTGKLKKIILPDNTYLEKFYTVKGEVAKVRDYEGKETSYYYDSLSRVIKTQLPTGLSLATIYDDFTNTKTEIDGLGRKTIYYYDDADRLVKVLQKDGTTAEYTYNTWGELLQIKDLRGLRTTNEYDSWGRLSKTRCPDNREYHYEYDLYGNLIKIIQPDGSYVTITYDDLNRVLKKNYSKDNREITYEYDYALFNRMGRLSKVIDDSGSTEIFYDEMGQITKKTSYIQGRFYEQRWTYDLMGNLTVYMDPAGKRTYYEYDQFNRVSKQYLDFSGVKTQIAKYNYGSGQKLLSVEYGNGTYELYTYDLLNRLTQIDVRDAQGAQIFKHIYAYDNNNNRTAFTYYDEYAKRGKTYTYGYDQLDQLLSVIYPNRSTYQYKYDASGNRAYFKHAFGEVNYKYDSNSDRLAEYTDNKIRTICTYDSQGNLIKKVHYQANGQEIKKLEYTFNSSGQLIQAKATDLFDPQKSTEHKYIYNAEGDRVIKEIVGETHKTIFHTTGKCTVTLETNEFGNPLAHYSYGAGGKTIARITYVNGQEKLVYYHNDILGSVTKITDQQGKIIQSYYYDAYGNIDLAYGSDDNQRQFTGKEIEEGIELTYFGSRWYDQAVGRFISEDPAAADQSNPQTLNRYVYCINNPLKHVDPDGEWFWVVFCFAVGAATAGAIIGAAIGAITALLTGRNILEGALYGAIGGALAGFSSSLLGGISANLTFLQPIKAIYDVTTQAMALGQTVDAAAHGDWSRLAMSVGYMAVMSTEIMKDVQNFANDVGKEISNTMTGNSNQVLPQINYNNKKTKNIYEKTKELIIKEIKDDIEWYKSLTAEQKDQLSAMISPVAGLGQMGSLLCQSATKFGQLAPKIYNMGLAIMKIAPYKKFSSKFNDIVDIYQQGRK